ALRHLAADDLGCSFERIDDGCRSERLADEAESEVAMLDGLAGIAADENARQAEPVRGLLGKFRAAAAVSQPDIHQSAVGHIAAGDDGKSLADGFRRAEDRVTRFGDFLDQQIGYLLVVFQYQYL